MRKLTASLFAGAILAGGTFAGVAAAASGPSHDAQTHPAAQVERTLSRDRAPRQDSARHESASRDRTAHHGHSIDRRG